MNMDKTSNTDVQIREAKPEDCEDIIRLIQELAAHLKMPDRPMLDADTLRRDGFGERQMFRCFVAQVAKDKTLVGYAMYYYSYSAWSGRSAFLEDLYVTPSYRHCGIGTRLWRAVAREALDRKCRKLNWLCQTWNQQSIEFYESKGSRNLTNAEDWNVFSLYGQSFVDFANGVK